MGKIYFTVVNCKLVSYIFNLIILKLKPKLIKIQLPCRYTINFFLKKIHQLVPIDNRHK